mmetsp:Transcript_108381/g.305623  ORF Transcript_108381/g.305623 Transcript_108381/m.305623 type:complete len:270 (-) Transcript_108381:66-875(-)
MAPSAPPETILGFGAPLLADDNVSGTLSPLRRPACVSAPARPRISRTSAPGFAPLRDCFTRTRTLQQRRPRRSTRLATAWVAIASAVCKAVVRQRVRKTRAAAPSCTGRSKQETSRLAQTGGTCLGPATLYAARARRWSQTSTSTMWTPCRLRRLKTPRARSPMSRSPKPRRRRSSVPSTTCSRCGTASRCSTPRAGAAATASGALATSSTSASSCSGTWNQDNEDWWIAKFGNWTALKRPSTRLPTASIPCSPKSWTGCFCRDLSAGF